MHAGDRLYFFFSVIFVWFKCIPYTPKLRARNPPEIEETLKVGAH